MKKLIWVFMFVLMVVSVSAVNDIDILNNMTSWYKFEYGSPASNTKSALHTLTLTGNSNQPGKLTGGQHFDSGAGDGYLQTDNVYDRLQNSQDFSVNFWVKADNLDDGGSPVGQWDGGSNTRWSLYMDQDNTGTGKWDLYWCNGWMNGGAGTSGQTVDWQMWSVTWNESANDVCVYIDGSRVKCLQSFTCGADAVNKFGGFDDAYSVDGYAGVIDELTYHNSTLNASYISYMYNSGNARNYSTTTFSTQNRTPLDNTQFNSTINFTIFGRNTNKYNTTLWVNVSYGNGTMEKLVQYQWNNSLPNVWTKFSRNFNIDSGRVLYHWFNLSKSTETHQTEVYTTYYDTVVPAIITKFTNNTLYYNNNITGKFNFSDDFSIFSYNITIDGSQIDYRNNILSKFHIYNLSYDISNIGAGKHVLGVKLADGHTAKEIPNYGVRDGVFNNYLEYTFPQGGFARLEHKDSSVFDNFKTKKQKDRYNFEFKPNNKKSSYTFTVNAHDNIEIIETDSKYKNYLIFDGHWMDFVLEDQPQSKVDITRINNNNVEVTVSNLKDFDMLNFSSIGDLNVVEKNYTFLTFNVTATYQNPVVESQTHNTNILININGTGLTDANFSTTFRYNRTQLSTLKTSDGSTYVNFAATPSAPAIVGNSSTALFNWTINLSNTLYQLTYNHTILKINIGDCEDQPTWAKALTFWSVDEEKNETSYVDNTTLNIDLQVWSTVENSFRNFSFGFKNSNNYSICIYPNQSNYRTNAVMEYFAPNMANRKYYLDNYTLNNVTDTIYLYNINSSKASDITMYVVDQVTNRPVTGAFIKILRYYPELGSYKVVEIEKSDENGYALGKMVVADVFYKFIVEYNRNVVLDTAVQRILSFTKRLPVSGRIDVLKSFIELDGVNSAVSCNNVTKVCRFTWSDTGNIVQSATMEVYRHGNLGRNKIFSQTVNAVAGTITYTVTENVTDNSYNAVGFIHSNTQYSMSQVGEAFMGFRQNFKDVFGLSLILPSILLLIAISGAFMEAGATGVIGGSLVGFFFLFIIGVIPLSGWTIMTFVIIGILMIGKMRA